MLFYIVALCVSVHALSFTYVKGMKVWASGSESIELEDLSEENDSSEEDLEDLKEGHCPFWEPFIEANLFFTSSLEGCTPGHEFITSHVIPVECPPPRA